MMSLTPSGSVSKAVKMSDSPSVILLTFDLKLRKTGPPSAAVVLLVGTPLVEPDVNPSVEFVLAPAVSVERPLEDSVVAEAWFPQAEIRKNRIITLLSRFIGHIMPHR